MVIGLILLANSSDVISTTLNRIAAAHEAMGSASFSATGRVTLQGKVSATKSVVRYTRPGSFVLEQTTDDSPDPVRVLSLSGKTLTVYDPSTRQYARRIFSNGVGVKEALATSGMQIDPLVVSLIAPGGMSEWVKQFDKTKNWKLSEAGPRYKLTLSGASGSAVLDVESATGRLTGLHIGAMGQTIDWTIRYGATPGNATFALPNDAFEVTELDPSLINPRYEDDQARHIAEKMFKAYDKPRALAVEVSTKDRKYKVWYKPGFVRQDDGNTDWLYGRGRLTVAYKGTTYSGESSLRETVNRLPKAHTRVEPFARDFISGRNYFRVVLGRGQRIRAQGKTKIEGDDCTILGTTGGSVEYTLIVREKDGLVLSLGSQPTGGNTDLSEEMSFRYLPVSGVLNGRDMKVSAGGSGTRPISELK